MRVSFDRFLPQVLPEAMGCPEVVALNAVRNSAVDFCERSSFWRVDSDPIAVTPGENTYDTDAPAGVRVVQVRYAMLDGQEIVPRSQAQLDRMLPGWRTAVGRSTFFTQPSPDQVMLAAVPDFSGALFLSMVCAPTRDAQDIEEYVFQEHLETIAHGALARLMAMPGKPWAEPNAAMFHAGLFDDGVGRAAWDAARSFTRAPLRTTSQFR